MDSIFKFNNVSYSYNKKRKAVDGVSFEIFKGESVALLGANGSGKSTILKMMNALVFPDQGDIDAFNKKLNENSLNKELKDFRIKTGFVFQDSDAQLFNSSIFEEVGFALLSYGEKITEIEKKVDAILDKLNISHLKYLTPWQLSGGEKKKVALASILIYNPEVILLDEPTNSLDPKSKRWIMEYLKELNTNGHTIIISTNDLDFASKVTEKSIVILENHQILIDGLTKEIVTNLDILKQANLV